MDATDEVETAESTKATFSSRSPIVTSVTSAIVESKQPRSQGPLSSYLEKATLVAAGHVSARFLQIPEM